MSKRSIYDVYDYEANTGNYDPIAPLAKIKPIPDPDVDGKVLTSIAGSEESIGEWSSNVTLNNITASTGQIVTLSESGLDQCVVKNSTSTVPGVVKYNSDKFKYVGEDGTDWVVSAYKSTDPPPIPSGAYTIGIGGSYSNLRQAAEHFNDLPGNETITLILLNDMVVEQNIILKRNYLIQSRYEVPYKLTVDFTNQPAFDGSLIRFMYPTGANNYDYSLKLKNIWFDIKGNDFANATGRYLFNHFVVDAGNPDKYCHVDIEGCKFIFTGKHNYGAINLYGTLNLINNLFDIDRQPIFKGPAIGGTIHVQDNPDSIDSYYSQLIRLYFDSTIDTSYRTSTIKSNDFRFQVSRTVDEFDSEVQGMCPIQAIYCSLKSNFTYTLDCESNHHFMRAHCGNTPWVPFSGGYDFRDAPSKDWLWYRKLNWQLCNYCMEGQFNFQSDSEEFNFYLYSMNNYAVGSIGRRILPVAPFSLSVVNTSNTPKITVTDYKIGFTGSLIKAEIGNGYYPTLDNDTPRVTPYQNNYGLYQFGHILGAGSITKDSGVWSRISLFNYLGCAGGYNSATIRAILFDAVVSDNGEQDRLMDTVNLDLVSNTRDIVDSGIIPSLSTSLATTNTNLSTTNTNVTNLTSRVTTNETNISTLQGRVNQNVNTTSAPSFTGLTLNGNLTVTGTVDGRDVSVDGGNLDTVVGRVNQSLTTTSTPSFSGVNVTNNVNASGYLKGSRVLIRDSTDTDTTRFISALDGGMAANSERYFNLGRTNSAGNQGELGYRWVGDANASNEMFLGFHSYKALSMYYDGRVMVPGSIVLVNNNNAALNVEGSMNWNSTRKAPRFYNGTVWHDVTTLSSFNTLSSQVSTNTTNISTLQSSNGAGRLFSCADYVLAKSDGGSFGWNNRTNTFGPNFLISANPADNAFFWITFDADPNCNLTCIIQDMGRSQNITPYDFQWRVKRENTLNFKLEAVKGAPPWNNLTDYSGGILNVNSIMANTASVYLRIMFFRTS